MISNSLPSADTPPDGSLASPDGAHGTDEAVLRFTDAVTRLTNDPESVIDSFTGILEAIMPPPRPQTELTSDQVARLIEEGSYNVLGQEAPAFVRGSLGLTITPDDAFDLRATWSVGDTARHLGWEQQAVLDAESEGRLHSTEILGQPRFPTWQFEDDHPGKLIPGLDEIIKAFIPRWGWHSLAGFMATSQPKLTVEQSKTPRDWLVDGGSVDDVLAIATQRQ